MLVSAVHITLAVLAYQLVVFHCRGVGWYVHTSSLLRPTHTDAVLTQYSA